MLYRKIVLQRLGEGHSKIKPGIAQAPWAVVEEAGLWKKNSEIKFPGSPGLGVGSRANNSALENSYCCGTIMWWKPD